VLCVGADGSVLFKALRYKPEGAGSRSDEVNEFLSIYLILPATLGPGVYSASNRNEYQKQKIMYLRVECGRCVGLTTLPPPVSRLSILSIKQPYRPPRSCQVETLPAYESCSTARTELNWVEAVRSHESPSHVRGGTRQCSMERTLQPPFRHAAQHKGRGKQAGTANRRAGSPREELEATAICIRGLTAGGICFPHAQKQKASMRIVSHHQWSSTWGTRRHLTHQSKGNTRTAWTLSQLRPSRPRTEVLACQKRAQSSH
jgi:hypothetical protein